MWTIIGVKSKLTIYHDKVNLKETNDFNPNLGRVYNSTHLLVFS